MVLALNNPRNWYTIKQRKRNKQSQNSEAEINQGHYFYWIISAWTQIENILKKMLQQSVGSIVSTWGSLFNSWGVGIAPLTLWFVLYNSVLSKATSSTIFESLVWLDLGLNPGLPGHWRRLYYPNGPTYI